MNFQPNKLTRFLLLLVVLIVSFQLPNECCHAKRQGTRWESDFKEEHETKLKDINDDIKAIDLSHSKNGQCMELEGSPALQSWMVSVVLPPKSNCFSLFSGETCSGRYLRYENVLSPHNLSSIAQTNLQWKLLPFNLYLKSIRSCDHKSTDSPVYFCRPDDEIKLQLLHGHNAIPVNKSLSTACVGDLKGKSGVYLNGPSSSPTSISLLGLEASTVCIEFYERPDCEGRPLVRMYIPPAVPNRKPGEPLNVWNLWRNSQVLSLRQCSDCRANVTVSLPDKHTEKPPGPPAQSFTSSKCEPQVGECEVLPLPIEDEQVSHAEDDKDCYYLFNQDHCTSPVVRDNMSKRLLRTWVLNHGGDGTWKMAKCVSVLQPECWKNLTLYTLADYKNDNTQNAEEVPVAQKVFLGIAASLALIMLIVVTILSILLWRKKQRLRFVRKARRPKPNTTAPQSSSALTFPQITPIEENDYVNDVTGILALSRSFSSCEISRESISIGNMRESTAQILGVGEFSIALKGTLEPAGRQVAVKTMKTGQGTRSVKAALRECQVIMSLGRNHRFVELIGVCTEGIARGEIFMVFEFCEKGALKTFLTRHKGNFCNLVKDGEMINDDDGQIVLDSPQCTIQDAVGKSPVKFNTLQLMKWCCEVADAMEFLATRKIVHVTLSARNVLLDTNFSSKLSDFHLVKLPGESALSRINNNKDRLLPWRWFAIESLVDDIFTTQSDVWTYGVFMWEVFTLGGTPYPEFTYGSEFTMSIKHGFRLAMPNFSTLSCYELMLICWFDAPEKRPSFTKLKSRLSALIRDALRTSSRDCLHIP